LSLTVPVESARMRSATVKIRVTWDHIKRGCREFCWCCPVALAVLAAIPGSGPSVILEIDLTYRGRRYSIETPDEVLDWMTRFDRGQQMQLFEFELPLPWEKRPEEQPAATTAAA
jgi:hypothetical protein